MGKTRQASSPTRGRHGKGASNGQGEASTSKGRQASSSANFALARKIRSEMGSIFSDAQYTNKVNESVEKLRKVWKDYIERGHEDVLYEEFKRNVRILLTYPETGQHRKPLFDFIIRFLVKQSKSGIEEEERQYREYQEELTRFQEQQGNSEDSDDDEEADQDEDRDELLDLIDDKPQKRKGRGKKPLKKKTKRRKPKLSPPREPQVQPTILDRILQDVIPTMLRCEKTTTEVAGSTIRINCCYLIRRCLNDMGNDGLVDNIYNILKKELVEQMSNRNAAVRVEGVKALHRFQDRQNEKDVVNCAFKFHLQFDNNAKVRSTILSVIEPTDFNRKEIVARIQDVTDIVRKAAYRKIVDKIQISRLEFGQRRAILREGLNDPSPSVRHVVEKFLVPKWLSQCDELLKEHPDDIDKIGIMRFLTLIDIEAEPKVAEQLLKVIFKLLMSQQQGNKSKLHLLVETFRYHFLDPRNLLVGKAPLTVENTFMWQALANFCRASAKDLEPATVNKDDGDTDDNNYEKEIDDLFRKINIEQSVNVEQSQGEDEPMDATPGPSQNGQHDETENSVSESGPPNDVAGPTPPKRPKTGEDVQVDLIDMILPQLPHICYFLKKFSQTVDKTEVEDMQLAEYNFIYEQLTKILKLVEVGDPAQQRNLICAVREIIRLPNLTSKLTDVISPLIEVLAKNVFKSSEELLRFSQELIYEIYNSIDEAEEVPESPPPVPAPAVFFTPAEMKKIEIEYADLSVKIEIMRDKLDTLAREKRFAEADILNKEITEIEKKRDELGDRKRLARGELEIQQVIDPIPCSQQTQSSQRQEVMEIKDHPLEHKKCLLIFSGCLEYGHFKTINTDIQTNLDKLVLSAYLSDSDEIRRAATKALGLCCLISLDISRKYLTFLNVVIQNDPVEAVKNAALMSLFDIICQHGLTQLMNNPGVNNAGDADSSQSQEISENLEDFIINLFDAENSSEETKQITIKGIAKLLLLKRISKESPKFQTKLPEIVDAINNGLIKGLGSKIIEILTSTEQENIAENGPSTVA